MKERRKKNIFQLLEGNKKFPEGGKVLRHFRPSSEQRILPTIHCVSGHWKIKSKMDNFGLCAKDSLSRQQNSRKTMDERKLFEFQRGRTRRGDVRNKFGTEIGLMGN